MRTEIGELFLRSESISIPYETIGGAKQVSEFVLSRSGVREIYLLQGNESDVGPSGLSCHAATDNAAAGIAARQSMEIAPVEVQVSWRTFRYEGKAETIIGGIVLRDSSGRTVRLVSDGAAYPYCVMIVE